MKDSDNNPIIAFFIGIFFGCLIGMVLFYHFSCLPFKDEAIERGYAEYVLANPTDPYSAKFTWK